MLLITSDDRLAAAAPERFRHAWTGLMGFSFLFGIGLTFVWGAAWRLFKEPGGILFTPAALTLAVYVLGPYRRAAAALVDVVAGRDAAFRPLAAASLLVVLAMAMLGLAPRSYHRDPLLPWLQWALPDMEIYRVLILMPLWGAWATVVTGQFRKPDAATEPAVAAFVRGGGAVPAAVAMAVPFAGTCAYFNYLGLWMFALAGAGAIGGILSGLALARMTGGLNRRALLAGNLVTQLVFLAAYLATR